jgi:serine/threonine-protein kinase
MDVGALDDGSPFLVMELLEGRDLDSVVRARPHLPISTAVNYVLQACEGVAETHAAGVVHRDIKPSNLFITHTTDGSVRIKLLDFGISKITGPLGDARVTVTQALVGSPVYMSPEQMRSRRDIDGRTDIWSLGVILFELLADGCLPFEAPTLPAICARVLDSPPPPLRKIRRDIPRALEAVVLRCLQKDPDRRFQTVAGLAEALARFGPADGPARARRVRRILEGSGIARRPAGALPARSRRRLVPGLAVAAVLGVVAAVFMQRPSHVKSTVLVGRTSLPAPSAPAPTEPVAPSAPAPIVATPEPHAAEPDSTPSRAAHAQGVHRSGSRKHYVIEPVASPDPAPPIVVPAQVTAPAKSTDELTPYDPPVPDLGTRE